MTSRRLAAALSALTLGLTTVAVTTAPADAAKGKYYASCDKLHKDYRNGVAKNKKAANRAVRDGYGRPSTTKKAKAAYWTNYTRLDRDRDGTACEA